MEFEGRASKVGIVRSSSRQHEWEFLTQLWQYDHALSFRRAICSRPRYMVFDCLQEGGVLHLFFSFAFSWLAASVSCRFLFLLRSLCLSFFHLSFRLSIFVSLSLAAIAEGMDIENKPFEMRLEAVKRACAGRSDVATLGSMVKKRVRAFCKHARKPVPMERCESRASLDTVLSQAPSESLRESRVLSLSESNRGIAGG